MVEQVISSFTKGSNFYYLLERDNKVMTDLLFNLFVNCQYLQQGRVKSQITKEYVRKTNIIENLRIHVERAISSIKTHRILKETLPIIVKQEVAEIVLLCDTLISLEMCLVKSKKAKTWYFWCCL